MFPIQTNLGPSDSSYIVPARNAMATAAFGSHVEEEYYDQPIMQRCTPVEKLYAALGKFDSFLVLMQFFICGKDAVMHSIAHKLSIPSIDSWCTYEL